ncbi:MAG: cupin domain-containing protein [Gemmatimonadetes bacterium]|jgi:uncharacterized cupin superfamily protein|nr:cupin domain-containing protein [Gemmatimonadota bacterium]MBT7862793.1 cupin domain-containing protein [Gemmatimonadota bacterium]
MHRMLENIKERIWNSPKGDFGVVDREVFGVEETKCPFDMEHVTLPPGKKNYPFHSHGALWEMYYAVAGAAKMRTDEETVDFKSGESYLCRPGLAHQIINDTDADFVYLVISNDPPYDACFYPDSGKMLPRASKVWSSMPEDRDFWQPNEAADYFTGEE